MKLEKYDKMILRLYCKLPFPMLPKNTEEYEYITDLDFHLLGFCDRLLSSAPIDDYKSYIEVEPFFKQEFEEVLRTCEDTYELNRYYQMYTLVKEILKKYTS